ncbi:MAG TPA: SDR family oxidoreductase [Acidimicrobiia bacterium]
MVDPHADRSVLVTGAGGYLGRQLIEALTAAGVTTIVAFDVRDEPLAHRVDGVVYRAADVRDPALGDLLREHAVDCVVHLAAIVNPGKGSSRELEYSIDVGGTENVLRACIDAGVGQLVVTSSGAAYGYHADNPVPLSEDDALRGNPEFAYSDHKRQVEELLARARVEHPELRQLIFRPGAILGDTTRNQITDLFEKKAVLGVAGSDAPFTFIWDRDVVACLVKGMLERASGIFNLAGDGMTTMPEIARRLGKRYVPLPAWLIRAALTVLHPLRLSQYGPEQVDFLRYRPVLSNTRLKEEFGYRPRLSSTEVFEHYRNTRGLG